MIRSVSPASARTGGADKARLSSLPCARAVRASGDDCRSSAAACCCGTGQPEMSSPSRSSRSSKSAIFIVDKTCSRNAATYFVVLREAKAPWQSLSISWAADGASQPSTGTEKRVRGPKCLDCGTIRPRNRCAMRCSSVAGHRGPTGESMRPRAQHASRFRRQRSSRRHAVR